MPEEYQVHVSGTCWDCVKGYGVLNPPCCAQKADPHERCPDYEKRKEPMKSGE